MKRPFWKSPGFFALFFLRNQTVSLNPPLAKPTTKRVKGIYRVLYVDDEPDLLEVDKLFLEQSGQLCVDIITSAPAALSRIQKENFDAIVSDYQMPEMDGIAFLKIIRASYPDLPFILFTGRGREEVVIEAINNGVDSYLQKGGAPTAQFAELLHRIIIAIERRRAVRALKESEKKYRSLLEGLRDSIIVHRNTRILYLNPACEKVLGYSQESLLGKSIMILVPPEFHELVTAAVKKRMAGETFEPYELDLIRGDGTRISVIMSGSLVEFEGAPASVNLITDITERKRAQNALQESEKKYRSVIENIQDIYYRTDKDGNVLMASPSGASLLGYDSVNEVLGKQIATFYYDPAERTELLAGLQKTGSVSNFETRVKKKDGTGVFVSTNSHYYFDESGAIAGVEGIIRDITEQKRAEEALRESEIRFRSLIQNASDMIRILDCEGKITYESPSSTALLGYPPGETIGRDPFSYIHPDDVGRVKQKLKEVYDRTNAGIPTEFRIRRSNGTYIWVDAVGTNMLDVPAVNGIVITTRPIEQRKKMEKAIRESEEKYRTLIEHSQDGIFVAREGRLVFCNRNFLEMLGYTVEEATGAPLEQFIAPEDREMVLSRHHSRLNGKKVPDVYECSLLMHDGTTRHIIRMNVGRVVYKGKPAIIGTVHDITEERLQQDALRESEEKFRGIFNNINDGIHISELNADGSPGRFLDVNGVACRMVQYTYEEMLQMAPLDIATRYHSKPVEEIFREHLTAGHSIFETEQQRKDGTFLPVEINTRVVTLMGKRVIVSVVRDITDRKRAEEALREANKKLTLLSSITRHDILNKVSIQQGLLVLARKKVKDSPEMGAFIDKMESATRAIRDQIEFTRIYQDLGSHEPQWQDLHRTLAKIPVPPHLSIADDCAGTEIFADIMLEKVFGNLIDNAIRHGGNVTKISLTSEEAGGSLVIRFEDNGNGIPKNEKEKIFERGFGKNTGLGLFLAREVLAITGMTITETGEEGKGARFEITVPDGMYRIAGPQ